MDFFDYQERARSNTKRLVFLFGLAVVLTVATVYLCIAGLLNLIYLALGEPASPASYGWWLASLAIRFGSDGLWNWELLGWVAGAVMTVVVLGSSFKLWQLSGGGAAVAGLLGGRLLDLNTSDPNERRLLNVVEEMAIAAGLPTPDVWCLRMCSFRLATA